MADNIYRSHAQIVDGLVENIKSTDPTWVTHPGTPLRSIINSFASMLESITLDAYTAQLSFDLDSKTGSALDAFVSLFGFERKSATKSTGFVTFMNSDSGGASIRYIIPKGTRVIATLSGGNAGVAFVTSDTVTLEVGSSSVEAPIVAESAGTIYNVIAGNINILGTSAQGVSSVINDNATSGGTDIESDDSLRERFKKTIFRNIAGTNEAYLSSANTNENVPNQQVAVYSQSTRFEEVVQFAGGVSEIQTVTFTGGPTGGNAILTFEGQATSGLAYNVSASDMQTALEALSNIAVGDVSVARTGAGTLGSPYVYTITFQGNLRYSDRTAITASNTFTGGTTPTVTVATPTAGVTMKAYLTKSDLYSESDLVWPISTTLTESRNFYSRTTDYSILIDANGNTYLEGSPSGSINNNDRAVISYEYKSRASRADEYGNTRNVVDIYIGGSDVQSAVDLATTDWDINHQVNVQDQLSTSITSVDTTIYVSGDIDRFPNSGTILIDDEEITYKELSINAFLYCTRGANATVAASHTSTTTVFDINDRYYIKPMFRPVESVSDTIISGSTTYYEGINYKLIKDRNEVGLAYSNKSFDVIAWESKGYQKLTITGNPTGGTFTVTHSAQTTAGVDFDATGPELQTALEGLSNLDAGDVYVTKIADWTYLITLTGTQNTLTTSGASLTGGTTPATAMSTYVIKPSDNTQVRIDYTYDSLPKTITDVIYLSPIRNITADVLVHSGREVFFDINLCIMHRLDSNTVTITDSITSEIQNYIDKMTFGSTIQLHDIIDVAYNTPGVDNVRFTTSLDDADNYGIVIKDDNGSLYHYNGTSIYEEDFTLGDDELPVVNDVNIILKAQNSWNA